MSTYPLLLLVLALFIIALAKPVLPLKSSSKNSMTPLVVALDISPSMIQTDVYPNRFTFAKTQIKRLLNESQNLRVALLLFNRDAFIASPLSEDLDSFVYILSHLETKFQGGSNLFAALEGSELLLHKYKAKNILLVSDGTSSRSFTQEALYLQKHKLILHTLYVSKEVPKSSALKELSLKSAGSFTHANFSDKNIKTVLKQIAKHSQKIHTRATNKQVYKELFYYPLLLAVVLLLILFTSRYDFHKLKSFVLVLSLTLLYQTTPLNANLLDFKHIYDAKEFYKNKEYPQAIELYRSLKQTPQVQYNLANALYKAKMFTQAIQTYKQIKSSDKNLNAIIYFNIANAHFSLGEYKLAKKNYVLSLKLEDDLTTQENLNRVLTLLKQAKHPKSSKEDKHILAKTRSSYTRESPKETSSNYTVQVHHLVPSEIELWEKKIQNAKTPIFLQKCKTTRRSQNADKDD